MINVARKLRHLLVVMKPQEYKECPFLGLILCSHFDSFMPNPWRFSGETIFQFNSGVYFMTILCVGNRPLVQVIRIHGCEPCSMFVRHLPASTRRLVN